MAWRESTAIGTRLPTTCAVASCPSESMGKTMKMKLKKIEDIKTSRSEMEMYSYRSEEAGQSARLRQAEATEPQFYKTHYKVLQGKLSEQRNIDFGKTQLFVRPHRKEEKKEVKPKLYYHSPNLEEKMTLYLNNLLNRSREEKLESKEPRFQTRRSCHPHLVGQLQHAQLVLAEDEEGGVASEGEGERRSFSGSGSVLPAVIITVEARQDRTIDINVINCSTCPCSLPADDCPPVRPAAAW